MDVDATGHNPAAPLSDSFVRTYNLRLTKKLVWMAGQFGSINDTVSINNWATSMTLIKNLLYKSPIDQFQAQSQARPVLTLSRSQPLCISNFAPSLPAMSIFSVTSSHLLPSPSPTTTRTVNLEHSSADLTDVATNNSIAEPTKQSHNLGMSTNVLPNSQTRTVNLEHTQAALTDVATNLVNAGPMRQTHNLCQSTNALPISQSCGIKRGKHYRYTSAHKCLACDSYLEVLGNQDTLCQNCNLTAEVSTGKYFLWNCLCCTYLSCDKCLMTFQKRKKKKRYRR